MKIIKWFARISAFVILVFTLPFYFGYGNPLPFVSPGYSLWENTALMMFPLVLVGLFLGWKYEKVGGFLIFVPIAIVFLVGFFSKATLSPNFLFPLIPGILYLISGYKFSEEK